MSAEAAREEFRQKVRDEEAAPPDTWEQALYDIGSESLTMSIVADLMAPTFPADEHFTDEHFEALTKEAVKNGFPLDWLPELEDAHSFDHFNYLLSSSQSRIDAQQRIGEAGWGVWGANFLANMLDPASVAIGVGVLSPALKAQRALQLGTTSARALQATAGAASGVAVVGALDATGHQPTSTEYLFATALGAVIGGAFGPLAQNPATAAEAATLAKMGQRMRVEAEKLADNEPIPSNRALVPYVPAAEPQVTRHQFRPSGEAGAARAADEAVKPPVKVTPIDHERALEIQIEANRLHVEEAKAQLKMLKRGSPEAEEVRLAAVAANKDMAVLQQQLKRLQETGELPGVSGPDGVMFHAETNPLGQTHAKIRKDGEEIGSAFVRDLGDEIQITNFQVADAHQRKGIGTAFQTFLERRLGKPAVPDSLLSEAEYSRWRKNNPDAVRNYEKRGDSYIQRFEDVDDGVDDLLPDPAILRQRIEELEEQLRNVGDDELADEIQDQLDQLQGFVMRDNEDFPGIDDPGDALMLSQQREALEMRLRGEIGRGGDADYIKSLQAQLGLVTRLENESRAGLGLPPIGTADADGSVGAAVNTTPQRPVFTDDVDPAVRALRDEHVPRVAFAGKRIDRSGFIGNSANAVSRWIGNKLFNNVVGMADHSKTNQSVDLDMLRRFDKYRVPYHQARMGAFVEYARAMGYSRVGRVLRYDEFDNHVGLALKSNGSYMPDHLPGPAQEAIRRTADALRNQYRAILEDMQAARIPGSENLDPNDIYMPRKFNARAIMDATRDPNIGWTGLLSVVRGAIQRAQPEMDARLLDRLSEGYARNVMNRAYDIGDDWTIAMRNGDRARFAALLRQDTDLADAEIDALMQHLWSLRDKSKPGFGNLQRRVLLNEFYVDERTGLAFHQLLDNNAERVFVTYARQASGLTALANLQLYAPRVPRYRTVMERQADGTTTYRQVPDGETGGELVFDGLRTDADEQRLFSMMQKWAGDHYVRTGEDIGKRTASDAKVIKFTLDRLRGIPDPAQASNTAQFMRNLRDYNFGRLMWQGGIAQTLEAGVLVGTLGVKATFSQVPGFRRIIDAAGSSRLQSQLFDELEAFGIGAGRLHGMAYHHLEQMGDDLPFAPGGASRWDRITNALSYGTKVTNEYSAMGWVTQMMERTAGAAVVQKFAHMADKLKAGKKLSGSDLKRAAQLGLEEADLQRIFVQLKDHAVRVNRSTSTGKITSIRLNEWADQEARAMFEAAVYRYTKKLVQTGDLGNTALWMSTPIWQTMFQFRNFTFTAWQNHSLYNLHMRDMPALMTVLWSTAWAAAVRGAQVKAIAALRPDGAEYEAKHLEPEALARAAFQRSGYASLLPAIMDSIALFTGQKPTWDARHTGQPTDVVGGSPSLSLVKSASEGIGGGIDALLRQRPISQAEVRAFMSTLPMATFIPLMSATSHMVKDLPKRAPRQEDLF